MYEALIAKLVEHKVGEEIDRSILNAIVERDIRLILTLPDRYMSSLIYKHKDDCEDTNRKNTLDCLNGRTVLFLT